MRPSDGRCREEPHNKPMHPTRDSMVFMMVSHSVIEGCSRGRVIGGVMRLGGVYDNRIGETCQLS